MLAAHYVSGFDEDGNVVCSTPGVSFPTVTPTNTTVPTVPPTPTPTPTPTNTVEPTVPPTPTPNIETIRYSIECIDLDTGNIITFSGSCTGSDWDLGFTYSSTLDLPVRFQLNRSQGVEIAPSSEAHVDVNESDVAGLVFTSDESRSVTFDQVIVLRSSLGALFKIGPIVVGSPTNVTFQWDQILVP